MYMKILSLMTVAFITVSASSSAKNIYADVQVTELQPTNNVMWKRKNLNTPKYPIELARSGIRGCAVLSFEISASGKTESVEIISAVPKKKLGKSSRKMLQKWHWTPTSTLTEPVAEKRTLRFDFCIDGDSTEQAEEACKQQTLISCK